MTAARLAVASVVVALAVGAAGNATTLPAVGPAAAYDVVPGLLVLDLVAAAALCAVAVWALARGRPLAGAAALGLAAACLLADALIAGGATGRSLRRSASLPSRCSCRCWPRPPMRRTSRGWRCGSPAPCAPSRCASSMTRSSISPAGGPARRTRSWSPTPPASRDAARAAAGLATIAWCALAARRRTAVIVLGVALAATRLAVGVDDPTRPGLRALHLAAAGGALAVAAAVAHDLLRLPRTRARLGRLLRDLRLADAWGLERCLREATGGGALRLVYHHPDRPVRIDATGAPVPTSGSRPTSASTSRRRGLTLATLLHAPEDVAAAFGSGRRACP